MMERKQRLAAALSIVNEGSPSRARANKFGWTSAELRRRKRLWEWACRVLSRRECGARRRRDGGACRAPNVRGSPRCVWHGGLSTGPRTQAGKARALANLRQFTRTVASRANELLPPFTD
ncbi:HGGxSTG domain-containing protein [Stenotrophomonas maltophilia]|uniref:HGGxSTG domain-containing protein n=1 Tax=Stenotrophomonas maltophilia TaxID=40324 RepID=UPI003D18D073